jgi:hypothetical protein
LIKVVVVRMNILREFAVSLLDNFAVNLGINPKKAVVSVNIAVC